MAQDSQQPRNPPGEKSESFWKRSEDYAKKVSDEILDQIKLGVASWQKPWKPGEQHSPEDFSAGGEFRRHIEKLKQQRKEEETNG